MTRGSSYSWVVSALECLNSSSGPGGPGSAWLSGPRRGCDDGAPSAALPLRPPALHDDRLQPLMPYALKAAAIQWLALCWLLMARRT
jgi:hypothetical protein